MDRSGVQDGVLLMRPPSDATLRRYLAEGPCVFCASIRGMPNMLAAHRLIDAIRARHKGGESIRSLADDYDLPLAVVRYLATAPLRELRKWRLA